MKYFIFLFSISFHELGHLIFGHFFKINIKNIKFGIFGFKAFGKNSKNKYKIFVYLAGPLFNFILFFICLKILKYNFKHFYIYLKINKLVLYTAYTNLVLGFLNLLPVLPLDGGNILKIILSKKLDLTKSTKITLIIGKAFLVFLTALYCIFIFYIKNIWIFCALIYLWIIFFKEEKNFLLSSKIIDFTKDCC